MEVHMAPRHRGPRLDGRQADVALLFIRGMLDLLGQVEIVPADDRVLDQAFARLGDTLFFSGLEDHLSAIGKEYRL